MVAFWRQIPPKTPPRCLQDGLGRLSLVPKRSQEPPKRRPRCAKNRPRAAPEASWKRPLGALGRRHAAKHPHTPSRPRFWTIFGKILESFWYMLGSFGKCWGQFNSFWGHFGTCWGHFGSFWGHLGRQIGAQIGLEASGGPHGCPKCSPESPRVLFW